MVEPWLAAPATLVCLLAALACHRRRLAILPEDPPAGHGRRPHRVPMPMAGFLPMAVVLAALGWWRCSWWVLVGVALATLTGVLDDVGKARGREMTTRPKALLLLAAVAPVAFDLGSRHGLGALGLLALGCWLFAITNAANFLDNTDGVACSLGGAALLWLSGGSGPLAAAGFAFLAFVPFNWPRPVLFLGDSGALGLGMCLAWGTAEHGLAAGVAHWAAAGAPVAVFALDFVQVVVARLVLGVPPWQGDRRHLTHVAMNAGLPKVLVAPVFLVLALGVIRLAGPATGP